MEKFFLTNIYGVIIVGVISSLAASIFWKYLAEKLYGKFHSQISSMISLNFKRLKDSYYRDVVAVGSDEPGRFTMQMIVIILLLAFTLGTLEVIKSLSLVQMSIDGVDVAKRDSEQAAQFIAKFQFIKYSTYAVFTAMSVWILYFVCYRALRFEVVYLERARLYRIIDSYRAVATANQYIVFVALVRIVRSEEDYNRLLDAAIKRIKEGEAMGVFSIEL